MLKVRRALADDAPIAARIIADALAEYRLPFEPEGRDADVATFGTEDERDDFVAEDSSGRVIGLVSVGPQGAPGVAWISKVFVAKAARRKGVGRTLLEAAHDAARRRGFREASLRTRAIFLEAIALYESLGYAQRPTPASDLIYHRPLSDQP